MKKRFSDFKAIQVHAGVFHCDDCMTVAMAKYINPNIRVIRSDEVGTNPSILVADVGGGRYDHHQPDAKLREDGKKYAACGLFFRDFGREIFSDTKMAGIFRRQYIIPIEDEDNGGDKNPLSQMIRSFIPIWDEQETMDEAFERAVNCLLDLIRREVEIANGRMRAAAYVKEKYDRSDGKVVILDKPCPWKLALDRTDAHYVIYPSDRGGFNLQSIHTKDNKKAVEKNYPVALPFGWKLVPPKGCLFLHSEYFLAVFDSAEHAEEAIRAEME